MCVSMFVRVILYVCFCVFCNDFYDSTHALLSPSSSHTYLAVFLLDAALLNQCTLSSQSLCCLWVQRRMVCFVKPAHTEQSSRSWCSSRLAGYNKLTFFYLVVTHSDPLRACQDLLATVNLVFYLVVTHSDPLCACQDLLATMNLHRVFYLAVTHSDPLHACQDLLATVNLHRLFFIWR